MKTTTKAELINQILSIPSLLRDLEIDTLTPAEQKLFMEEHYDKAHLQVFINDVVPPSTQKPQHTQGDLRNCSHTPTPWVSDDGHIFTENTHGFNSKYNSIATVHEMYSDNGMAQPNEKFILKAVNMHDELVAGFKKLQGLEAWIGDKEIQKLFHDTVNGLLKKAQE